LFRTAEHGVSWSEHVEHVVILSMEGCGGILDSYTSAATIGMAHDAVLDSIIEAAASRTADASLAATGPSGKALTRFTPLINQDVGAGGITAPTCHFTAINLTLFLPKDSTQATHLVGAITVAQDATGAALSDTTAAYVNSWGMRTNSAGANEVFSYDYTPQNLVLAPQSP
jgi:hypothetical protein